MTTSGSGSGPRLPRRNLGARTPTSRPRKVAGRQSATTDPTDLDEPIEPIDEEPGGPLEPEADTDPDVPDDVPDDVADDVPDDVADDVVESARESEPHHTQWPIEDPLEDVTQEKVSTPSRRVTVIAVALIVLLAGVAAAEGWYLWGRPDPVVSSQTPVVTGEVTATTAVDAAAKSAVDIVSSSYETYDEQVDLAASKMTDTFAEKFRETKAEIKKQFIAEKTNVTAEVSAQGVVQASAKQVIALVFLDQSTTKDGGQLKVAQYKVLVTVVRTASGWLVSQLETI